MAKEKDSSKIIILTVVAIVIVLTGILKALEIHFEPDARSSQQME